MVVEGCRLLYTLNPNTETFMVRAWGQTSAEALDYTNNLMGPEVVEAKPPLSEETKP